MQSMPEHNPFRGIPSVDRVLREMGEVGMPKLIVVDMVRRVLDEIRESGGGVEFGEVMERVRREVEGVKQSRIRPVINGTGIIIHTNFGRSPLAAAAVAALVEVASSYTNLEFDLARGERGGRSAYLERALALLCGAQATMVVNNCAAALVLALRHFAACQPRNKVVISRGELVQIGGGFRVPEILESSGAELREIGTTNRTTLEDYRQAIDGDAAMVLVVHRSNFYMEGFVESPGIGEIAKLSREAGIPLLHDLGSGAIFDTETLGGGEHEPTPSESLSSGASLVTFSGDKLLGGPQAGIIAGEQRLVKELKRDPLFRALRCDKLVLGALEATVELHLGTEAVPVIAMMRLEAPELTKRAGEIVMRLAGAPIAIGRGESQVGGGSLPKTRLESVCLEVRPNGIRVEELARRLRTGWPAIVGRIEDGALKLDLRTVFPEQDEALAKRLGEELLA